MWLETNFGYLYKYKDIIVFLWEFIFFRKLVFPKEPLRDLSLFGFFLYSILRAKDNNILRKKYAFLSSTAKLPYSFS